MFQHIFIKPSPATMKEERQKKHKEIQKKGESMRI
jgi:hypothetical protein